MGKAYGWFRQNKKLLLRTGILAGTSFLDYYFTDMGIAKHLIEECNPFVNSWINVYGSMSPYLMKSIFAAGGAFGMYIADKNPGRTRLNSDHIFYIGTGAYTAGSLKALYAFLL